ncbi:MAG: family 16 glycoside hydrolase [Limisphaerales bacterium]
MKRILLTFCGLWLAAAGNSLRAEEGFVTMFNGQDLTGWAGSPDLWSVHDGAITGNSTPDHPAKENTFLIWTNGLPADFEMRCSFKIGPDNSKGFAPNSGVQFRSAIVKPSYWVMSGYQADMEAGRQYTGGLYEEKARGILASRGDQVVVRPDGKIEKTGSLGDRAALENEIHHGDWNDYDIIAKGNHIQLFINGKAMVDLTDEQKDKAAASGFIGLQLHAGVTMTVQFKDLRIKEDKAPKKIVFIAGTPSHGKGEHEYRAGCLLLEKCLHTVPGIETTVYSNGWPQDPGALYGASAIVLSMDGSSQHAMLAGDHISQMAGFMERGVGLGAIHWAVEVTKEKGENEYLNWLGGAFEINWSVNPTWTADFATLPDHPITRGVKPFQIRDEWYYHMRFPEGMKGVTPILAAVAPASTVDHPDGPYASNPAVREAVKNGEPQVLAWAFERPFGGRGFGFTGAHYHKNWANDSFRKTALNGLLWIAGADVPDNGVECSVSSEELSANQDQKK